MAGVEGVGTNAAPASKVHSDKGILIKYYRPKLRGAVSFLPELSAGDVNVSGMSTSLNSKIQV